MSRIPCVEEAAAGPPQLVAAIRARRGGGLLNLDLMLLNSPALAAAWNAYLGVIRGGLALDARLRELAICGVAVLNGAEYEFRQHLPEFIRAGGTAAAAHALRDYATACDDRILFNDAERATIRLVLEMTCDVAVRDNTFAAARVALRNDAQLVELVGVVATYNMVSRFLVALQVEPEPPAAPPGAPA